MITIPVGEAGFTDYLNSTGLIEISMTETKGSDLRRRIEFQIASPIDAKTKAVLYSPSKPEVRTFLSLAALAAVVRRFGVEDLQIPLEPGSVQYRAFATKEGNQSTLSEVVSRNCA